ncbi:MAG: N(4)-(beta-N-acetylglucosaminyl)-L-asparaginase [Candidatus Fermentithermobacillus carboniphilus]|uniref:N(4)-(Beta-N-acetylglucosaminyl)-L-asparaginase n=1 Tax=Candidatus Fermentithermobacillus carboniphilus TaxID=3085328 RepID=A0AAT9LF63_9FIRM|nr:MAG: N(4)-(beta-N-acetylglucosaminyl)-L-asparaginase [Candidatus Fermentithermobacillus carboniphilus]
MEVLKKGGTAVDAVEAGIRLVESNPEDTTVGYGGLPNLLGEVELDASIMDGETLAAGAVGAVKGYEHPISIARKVMEELPHVMIVGEGAERFAREMGFEKKDLLTPKAREIWEKGLKEKAPDIYGERAEYLESLRRFANLAVDPEKHLGTVNFIAMDSRGHLATGVSTSGWAWKYPGRLGDSPVIGAGNYADSRYGAAACTGRGEMAIRLSTARSIVLYMEMGLSLEEAATKAMLELARLKDRFWGRVSCIVMDAKGNHGAFSVGGPSKYVVMTEDMDAPQELPRVEIPVPNKK